VYKSQRPDIAPGLVFAVDWEEGALAVFNDRGLLHTVTRSFEENEVRMIRECDMAASEGVGDIEGVGMWAEGEKGRWIWEVLAQSPWRFAWSRMHVLYSMHVIVQDTNLVPKSPDKYFFPVVHNNYNSILPVLVQNKPQYINIYLTTAPSPNSAATCLPINSALGSCPISTGRSCA
jgi:hypothetical protein